MDRQKAVWLLSEKGILGLDGEPLQDVPFRNVRVFAGDVSKGSVAVIVDRHEIWTFSEDKWTKNLSTEITLNCIYWTVDNRLLVGTEHARLAWVKDHKLDFIETFDEVPERRLWNTPWGGPPDVRSIAVSTDGTVYANVHVGWIVRSMDGGKTWKNLQKGLDKDVHQVAVHPHKPATVFTATANGFHISHNHGDTFIRQGNGMPYYYQRSCACFVQKDVYLVSTSRGPHGQADALLYRSEDEGQSWSLVNGLPENISKNIDTFHIAVINNSKAMVIVDDTHLYESNDRGVNWQEVGHGYPRLYGILAV
ncbi:MAG: hypothetical protein ACE5KZ_14150 [Candidatus Scalinduaceae bacterium]